MKLTTLARLEDFVHMLNRGGGPRENDYLEFVWLCQRALDENPEGVPFWLLRRIFLPYLEEDADTLISRILWQPEGYAGDYLTLEYLHNHRVTTKSETAARWDKLVLAQPSTAAVKERRRFLSNEFDKWNRYYLIESFLDVASGSGIALAALSDSRLRLQEDGIDPLLESLLEYHCIDQDTKALNFSRSKYDNKAHEHLSISWHESASNILRHRFTQTYDCTWSAGLFDYFSDKIFIHVGTKLLRQTNADLIIGAVGHYHSSKPLMELLGWKIYYRSEEELLQLGKTIVERYKNSIPNIGPSVKIEIEQDSYGVQKYLIFRKS